MPGEEQPHAPFDERAALEHLQRLQEDVEESRRRRKDASAAFDKFVGSFRRGADAGVNPAPPRVEPRPGFQRLEVPVAPVSAPQPRRSIPTAMIVGGGALAIAAGFVLTRVWRESPESSPLPATVQAPAPVQPESSVPASAPSASPAAGAAAAPDPSGGMRAELVAVRGVWVRATVDGVRLVERELRRDERVPLRASRAIVIRAGDAGALRITIDGQDRGPVGEDGVVATRTYTVAPPPAAPR